AIAKRKWPEQTNRTCIHLLETLTRSFRFSIASGDLLLLNNGWYVTHTGLLRLARRRRCTGIHVEPVPDFSSPATSRWAFKSIVFKSQTCKGFAGYGDADPSNVSDLVRGAEMRVAERSEEHTSELQSRFDLVCRLLLEKKKQQSTSTHS